MKIEIEQGISGSNQPKPFERVHGIGDSASGIYRLHGQSERTGEEATV